MQRRMKKNQYGSLVSVASIDSVLSAENSDTSRKDKKYISLFYFSIIFYHFQQQNITYQSMRSFV